MKTVIAKDRVGRFTELDHSVREEVQVIIEARDDAATSIAKGVNCMARPLCWLRMALQGSGRSARSS